MKNEKIKLGTGMVKVFVKADVALTDDIKTIISYWKNTMATYGFARSADFDIHVWNKPDFCHVEVGLRVQTSLDFGVKVARAIMILDILKEEKKGMFLVDTISSPWHDDIQGFSEDTARILKDQYGYSGFDYIDLNDFEMKFFRYEPMMLDANGRRIDLNGKVLLEEGYKTFGLTSQAMVDMLF